MGIRSDVGFAVKRVLDSKMRVHNEWVEKEAIKIVENEEGFLYIFEDIKWYTETDEDIAKLYCWLDENDEGDEDHLIVEACFEYPESNESNRGGWVDNPFYLSKRVTVELSYDE